MFPSLTLMCAASVINSFNRASRTLWTGNICLDHHLFWGTSIKMWLYQVHDWCRHLPTQLLSLGVGDCDMAEWAIRGGSSLWKLRPGRWLWRQIQSERCCPHVPSLASRHHKLFIDFLKIFQRRKQLPSLLHVGVRTLLKKPWASCIWSFWSLLVASERV